MPSRHNGRDLPSEVLYRVDYPGVFLLGVRPWRRFEPGEPCPNHRGNPKPAELIFWAHDLWEAPLFTRHSPWTLEWVVDSLCPRFEVYGRWVRGKFRWVQRRDRLDESIPRGLDGRPLFRERVDPDELPGQIPDGHDSVYCLRCDAMSLHNENNANAQKVGVTVKAEANAKVEVVASVVERRFRAKGKRDPNLPPKMRTLTEAERRAIWNGEPGEFRKGDTVGLHKEAKLTERLIPFRRFLRRINQRPDWSLVLDSRGRVIKSTEVVGS